MKNALLFIFIQIVFVLSVCANGKSELSEVNKFYSSQYIRTCNQDKQIIKSLSDNSDSTQEKNKSLIRNTDFSGYASVFTNCQIQKKYEHHRTNYIYLFQTQIIKKQHIRFESPIKFAKSGRVILQLIRTLRI